MPPNWPATTAPSGSRSCTRSAFADFPATHLRILGVPAALVRAVRAAPDPWALEQIPGLPPHAAHWLLDLAVERHGRRTALAPEQRRDWRDEGQDLTAVELRLAQRLLRGGHPAPDRSLLLLGDAAQPIYSRGFSWRQAGIFARGRPALPGV